jgi:hypothetical protein
MLISRRGCRKWARECAVKHHVPVSRVSRDFLDAIHILVEGEIEQRVFSTPIGAKTLRDRPRQRDLPL